MNEHHRIALARHCRFAFETADRRFAFSEDGKTSVVLTVNSGHE